MQSVFPFVVAGKTVLLYINSAICTNANHANGHILLKKFHSGSCNGPLLFFITPHVILYHYLSHSLLSYLITD